MVERSKRFPHIQLKLTTTGTATPLPGGGKKNPQTEQLFPPNILGNIINFYHKVTKTKIFNHSINAAAPLQKDWTVVKSFELTEAFCIAVVGHEGWNNDPDAEAPYSLVVSFEALEANIPIYTAFVEAQQIETQVELEVKQLLEIESIGGI